MTAILRMNRAPLSVLDELAGMQNQFNRMFDDWGTWSSETYPRINMMSYEAKAIVRAELPGVDPQGVEVSVVGDELTLSGKREQEPLPDGAVLFKQERTYGAFSRTLQLPFSADPQKVQAAFKNGMLTIVLPRAEADKPHRIRIEVA